jgi:hypothetical protein
MARLFFLAVLLLCGCRGVRGPFDPVPPVRVDDPSLPIAEQELLGRDRYALPDESIKIAPHSGAAGPLVPLYPQ